TAVVLVDAALLEGGDMRVPDAGVLPQSLAYIMYTSGSTGEPKGIEIEQAGVVDMVGDTCWETGQQRVLFHSPYAFDACTYEIWVPLLKGGELVVAPPGPLTAVTLRQSIETHDLTAVFLTTSLFNL